MLVFRRATLLPFFSSAHYVIPPLVSPVSFWLKRPSRRSPPPCPLPPPPAWVEGLSSCTRTARSPTAQYPYKRLWQPLEALALACLPACLPAVLQLLGYTSLLLLLLPVLKPMSPLSVCCPRRPPSSCSFRLHEPRKSRAILVVPTSLLLLDCSMPHMLDTFHMHVDCRLLHSSHSCICISKLSCNPFHQCSQS